MLQPELARCIVAAVDEGFDAQVSATQALVRFPSQRGNELAAQDWLYEEMRRRGLAMDRFRIEEAEIRDHPGFSPVMASYENAVNVIGCWRPERAAGRSLILNGHVDVVPTGPAEMWARDPYDPHIEGDWMYGRGAGDMKAGLIANLFAFDALHRAGFRPAAPVAIQSVVEEECTGNGALACWLRGYTADAVIIPEPAGEGLVRANAGVLWFRVKVRGRPSHASTATEGANAIEAAFRLIQALRRLEARWNDARREHRHFEHLEHPINLNIGKIEGGDWASSVPSWCVFDARIAIYPGVKPDAARREIETCLAEAARADRFLANNPPEVVCNGFHAEGYVLEAGTEAENVLRACHRAAFGEELNAFTMPGYLDARVWMLYGGVPSLVYGPRAEEIHAADERVSLESTRRVTQAIALFMAEWCGLQPA